MALNPSFPGLYCDPLWNTSIVPNPSPAPNNYPKNAVAPSINGALWNLANPTLQSQMITGINSILSGIFYGQADGFDCRTMCLGSRYVVMGGTNSPAGTYQADQLIVDGAGNITFLQTDWRIPPNYLPLP